MNARSLFPSFQSDPVAETVARRVGGLPLPSKSAPPPADATAIAAADVRAAAKHAHWVRHFAARARDGAEAAPDPRRPSATTAVSTTIGRQLAPRRIETLECVDA